MKGVCYGCPDGKWTLLDGDVWLWTICGNDCVRFKFWFNLRQLEVIK